MTSTELLYAGPGQYWGERVGVKLGNIYLGLTNHPGQLSLAVPTWVGAMKAVMLCSYGVKASMAHVRWHVR